MKRKTTSSFSLFCIIIMISFVGCTSKVPMSPLAQKGYLLYQARCTSCHHTNPKIAGSVGPEVYGASKKLLTAKMREGIYPVGYTPKRTTQLMPKQSLSDEEIQALFQYLNTKP